MTLSIRHPEAEKLARDLASQEGTTMTDVVLKALRDRTKAIRRKESPMESADRILRELGLTRQPGSHIPVPQSAYHDLDHDLIGEDD